MFLHSLSWMGKSTVHFKEEEAEIQKSGALVPDQIAGNWQSCEEGNNTLTLLLGGWEVWGNQKHTFLGSDTDSRISSLVLGKFAFPEWSWFFLCLMISLKFSGLNSGCPELSFICSCSRSWLGPHPHYTSLILIFVFKWVYSVCDSY